MDETARQARNAARLAECWPGFAVKVRAVLTEMESAGYRPRIQAGYRSPADQLAAFVSKHSDLKYGFHNCTGPRGEFESLAVDVLDDDYPLASRSSYLLHLAAAAERQGLTTGIRWGLPEGLREGIDDAIAAGNWNAPVKLGWDPTHMEPTGITVAAAQAGARP